MTLQQFKREMVDYYQLEPEQLPRALERRIDQWLSKYSDTERGYIFAELLKSFSRRWGKAPGIAELEEAWSRVQELRKDELEGLEDKARENTRALTYDPAEERIDDEEAENYFAQLKETLRSLGNAKRPEGVSGRAEEDEYHGTTTED